MPTSNNEQLLLVAPASLADFDAVMQLLSEARLWQLHNGLDVWKEFDPAQIAADIEEGRVFVARAGTAVCGIDRNRPRNC